MFFFFFFYKHLPSIIKQKLYLMITGWLLLFLDRVSESLQSIFSSRSQIRREHLVLERQLKENELRQRHSEECNQQAQLFGAKDKTEKV